MWPTYERNPNMLCIIFLSSAATFADDTVLLFLNRSTAASAMRRIWEKRNIKEIFKRQIAHWKERDRLRNFLNETRARIGLYSYETRKKE